jgi:7-carboxy-7-deazaguanine synthase (Cx14CxxC type)
MAYMVKSIFPTLQGEGANTGRPAVFCRFAGCNLWNGRERDRHRATCRFCDTDFVGVGGPGGGRFATANRLRDAVLSAWIGTDRPFVVFTGGEPTLQLDDSIIDALHQGGAELAVETNGTRPVNDGIDWICVSPKAGAPLLQTQGDEIKVAWPQPGLDLQALEDLPFTHRWLQPIDGPQLERNVRETIAECRARTGWRMSVQMHKTVGIP